MTTIKDKLHFTYNGVSSRTHGLINVELSNSMFEEQLVASRSINETEVLGNDTPLLHRIDETPLSFELKLAFESGFTSTTIDNVISWLFQDYYKPFFFEGKEDRIYYCLPEGESKIVHNGLEQGYITLNMRCKSSKLYSTEKTTGVQTVPITGTKTIAISNTGHEIIYPRISITKVGNGSITFAKDGKNTVIANLLNGEGIYINSGKEIIESSILNKYRYNDVTGDLLDLVLNKGTNTYVITGQCTIEIKYVFKYKF